MNGFKPNLFFVIYIEEVRQVDSSARGNYSIL